MSKKELVLSPNTIKIEPALTAVEVLKNINWYQRASEAATDTLARIAGTDYYGKTNWDQVDAYEAATRPAVLTLNNQLVLAQFASPISDYDQTNYGKIGDTAFALKEGLNQNFYNWDLPHTSSSDQKTVTLATTLATGNFRFEREAIGPATLPATDFAANTYRAAIVAKCILLRAPAEVTNSILNRISAANPQNGIATAQICNAILEAIPADPRLYTASWRFQSDDSDQIFFAPVVR